MSLEAELDQLLETATKENRVPGIAAVALDKSGDVLYKGAFGSTVDVNDHASTRITPSTPILIWSLTKLVTSIATLQLLESGKLASLDDPVEKYVPRISNIQVLDGWTTDGDDGEPIYRAPRTKPTIRQLLTHTAGFGYDFLDANTKRWFEWRERKQGIKSTGRKVSDFESPLSFDPGTKWVYGCNIDWVGWTVEAITGKNIEDYFQEHIIKPLGLQKTAGPWTLPPETTIHFRTADRTLVLPPGPRPDDSGPDDAPLQAWAGHYLVSTLEDYSQILLTVLNGGTHPESKVRLLQPSTVQDYLFTDQIPAILGPAGSQDIGDIKSVKPTVTADGTLLPGVRKGWTAGFMYNIDDVPGGRNAGSGAWAGISNHYYWVDPKAGKLGLVLTSVLPFMDKEVLEIFDEFEKLIYKY